MMLLSLGETYAQRQYFDLNDDFLLANFDLRPDEDDVHAAAALASMLQHPDLAGVDYHAVAGAYGIQGNTYITAATPELFTTLFGAKNTFWSDRHNEKTTTENRIRDKIVTVLNAGNQVFIQEAGQSDFTYDVLQKVINESNGVNAAKVKANVVVVQHSDWNENQATASKLNWVKANTDYERIADGNSGNNGTPQFKSNSSTWLNQAKAGSNPNTNSKNYWTQADAVCDNFAAGWENPTISGGGIDYSDCVEVWWIFNIGNTADNVSKFWDRYVTNTPTNNGPDPTVNCNSLPSSLVSSTSISASVEYTSDANRDVVIELWNTTSNSYIDEGKTTVASGFGTASVSIDLASAPAAGSNYQLKASIRPVGSNWTQNLDACNKSGITLTSDGGGENNCTLPWTSPNQSITQQTVNWTSTAIDISCASLVDISMDIEGLTPQQMEAADYLNIYYSVDGGGQVAISENTDGFAKRTISATDIAGSSLVLIINGKTSFSDETYNITDITVSESSDTGGGGDPSSGDQPTFNPGQDPKPSGKRWEKIGNMSDEFNGSSLDLTKWDNQDPQWKGRAPALFSVNAVSVGNGTLQIEADDELTQQERNQNPGFTHQGGLVRSLDKATYGYYETRMKGNKTCLSSTFWLFNKRNEFNGCDERTTELDVTENVGVNAYRDDPSKNWINNLTNSINSNTHSRGVIGNPGCGINEGQNGDRAPLGEPSSANFHVYGVWWKNANELLFYLDGNLVYTINPPADFDLGMYLRMVVESYDWNKPRAGWDGMNESKANRTTYYDWTRSWRLVDDNGGGNDSSTVDCNTLPSTLASSTSMSASVDYTSDGNRDVIIEIWDGPSNSYIDEGRVTVGAGAGTATVTIDLNTAPVAGSNYLLKASIRPVGTDWTQSIDACNKSNVSVTAENESCDLPWSSPNQSITKQTVNWTSTAIDISCASAVNISMDIEGISPEKMEAADYLNIYYSVDGGAQVAIFHLLLLQEVITI